VGMSATPTRPGRANLEKFQSSNPEGKPKAKHLAVAQCLRLGMSVGKMAKYMSDDPVEQKAWRQRIRNMIRNESATMAAAVNQVANEQMMMDLPAAVSALGRRAKKGRPDAIKLLFEASGFHNPKVKHEHSGDINVNLNVPRPSMEKVQNLEDPNIVDAEVVED
jgi:hypothetical protein